MTKKLISTTAALLANGVSAHAANILSPSDFIIGIGLVGSGSSYPGPEGPGNVVDGDPSTKYLNFAKENSGLIVTPGGASVAESIVFTSADDSPERDPTTFSIWGTNDPIRSEDNSLGNQESWTPILTNTMTGLPELRFASSGAINLSNGVSYNSYRVTFDTLRDSLGANSMQIADLQLFTGSDGSGSSILGPGVSIIAIDLDAGIATSDFPAGENPRFAIDGDPNTKYLNFGGANTGFIVTPGVGASIVDSFTITTANDAEERDPLVYTLFGTNDAITSQENSGGTDENWEIIQSGPLSPPLGRGENYGDIILGNNTFYTSYRFDVDFTNGGPLMQFADIQFNGRVPEPSTGLLALFGLLPILRRRR